MFAFVPFIAISNVLVVPGGLFPLASLRDYPNYSQALRRLGGSWGEDQRNAFLKQPTVACPGAHRDFAGLTNPLQRAAVIADLKRLN